MAQRRGVKITVIKRLKTSDILDKEAQEMAPDVESPCPRFKEGDEFTINDISEYPKNFSCPWAFQDIFKEIMHLGLGGSFPWIKGKDAIISCCTDGLRPVIFKIEALES
jgi:uncharacterized repeat protein (TIGR04076 family)